MGFFEFLNHWWNLPFLVMLGLTVVFFVLQLIGAVGHAAGGDHDVDADAEADADADADGDADTDHDHDSDHDGDGGGGMLAWLGVGRVPFMILWITLLLFAGFLGLFLNRAIFLNGNGAYPEWAFAPVLGGALIGGVAAVKVFGRFTARFVDLGGKGSSTKSELAGKAGVVASANLDDKFGEVRVHDAQGNEMIVHGCLKPGEKALRRGDKVVLVDFDTAKDLFWVTASPED